MCGIFALIHYEENETKRESLTNQQLQWTLSLIDARGPDYKSSSINVNLEQASFVFKASVLHLRGQEICFQPVIDDQSNVLLFNGEIYEFSTQTTDVTDVSELLSDTQHLMRALSRTNDHDEILSVFTNIIGPFALIFWHHSSKTLYFARDIFGRRSLCIHNDPIKKVILISSVAPLSDLNWTEVTTNGVHHFKFNQGIIDVKSHSTNLWNLDKIYPKTEKCVDSDKSICINDARIEVPLKLKLEKEEHFDPFYYLDENSKPTDEEGKLLLQFDKILHLSLSRRISKGKELLCQDCKLIDSSASSSCNHSSIAIAFSGGVDSTVLALTASDHIPKHQSIDLLNLAFGHGAPDRLTAASAFLELVKIKPERRWNLICIDVTKEVLERDRRCRIKYLIAPLNTVLDDSIGCALWYISKGLGRKFSFDCRDIESSKLTKELDDHIVYDPSETSLYRCPARILIVGMGIDEQLGGYSTHRSAWSQGGSVGLHNEISFQMRRLPTRNLGRDDRVGGDHGRDIKSPFLDETLVDYLNQLPICVKMRFDLPAGFGDKILLRRYAKFVLGLRDSSGNLKRAMQFGTRIAKLENKKESGHEICDRLL